MKNFKFFGWQILIFTLLVGLTFVGAKAQTDKGSKKVKVYFWEFNKETEGDDLIAFTREVDAKSPLRPTIEALIARPTAEEAKGFTGVDYGDLKLSSVKINRGVARIDFSKTIRGMEDYNPGDLLTLRFEAAVIRTAKQFPAVKKSNCLR